ncbi:MAG: ECF transporter S component [Clostridia bacterium]|nr:ECF transporter S component [Clostridia bacterium]
MDEQNQSCVAESTQRKQVSKNTAFGADCGTDCVEKGCGKTKSGSTSSKKTFWLKSARAIAKVGILTAIAVVLYMIRIPLPFIFPAFLEMQISELPALLAGFAMGPVAGCVVVVLKTLLRLIILPTTSFGVGEVGDIVMGCVFVVVSWAVYRIVSGVALHVKTSKKGAVWGLITGAVATVVAALLLNRFLLIPTYTRLYGLEGVLGLLRAVFPKITEENLYAYYLPLSVLPFNIIRCALSATITFFTYKKLSRLLHW